MPEARLPNNLKGWGIALIASFVGFIAGFAAIHVLNKAWK